MMPLKRLLSLGFLPAAALAAWACNPTLAGLPQTVHPTPTAAASSIGMSAGTVFTTDEGGSGDSSTLILPYSEGWARFGTAAGQLELHLQPGLGMLGYRFDLASAENGVGIALEPAATLGFVYNWDTSASGTSRTSGALAVGAGANLMLFFKSGGGTLYIVPRVAFSHYAQLGDNTLGNDTAELLSLGAVVGYDLGGTGTFHISIELGAQRMNNLDESFGDALWIVTPSLALRM